MTKRKSNVLFIIDYKPGCPYCERVETFLKGTNYPYEKNMITPERAHDYVTNTGFQELPQIHMTVGSKKMHIGNEDAFIKLMTANHALMKHCLHSFSH